LAQQFGNALVCVRYRLDSFNHRRLTTVELVVDTVAIRPPPPHLRQLGPVETNASVHVKVAYEETALRERIKANGGRWRPKQKVWELPRSAMRRLKLDSRVVEPIEAPNESAERPLKNA